jgi:RNA polymerase sigma-70 factor (ECF subfamily)
MILNMENIKSDIQLISEYISGDEKSLEILVKRYLKPVYNLVYGYAGNQADAEDIAQEVFVKIWKNIRKFNPEKSFKSWIFAIAKNTALDALKKKKAIPFSMFDTIDGNFITDTVADKSPLASEIAEYKENEAIIKGSLLKLPLKYQKIVSLRLKDLTFQSIAEIMGESINTVKSRYLRAIKLLKKDLN